jgi:hypothetical protein
LIDYLPPASKKLFSILTVAALNDRVGGLIKLVLTLGTITWKSEYNAYDKFTGAALSCLRYYVIQKSALDRMTVDARANVGLTSQDGTSTRHQIA